VQSIGALTPIKGPKFKDSNNVTYHLASTSVVGMILGPIAFIRHNILI